MPFIGTDRVKKIIESYSADRVLFGTDYPMWDLQKEMKSFFEMEFSRGDRDKILSKNAQKIYMTN